MIRVRYMNYATNEYKRMYDAILNGCHAKWIHNVLIKLMANIISSR